LLGFPDEIAPEPGDIVSQKMHLDAFEDTQLRATLEGLGVRRVLICGLMSEACVSRTIGGAVACGFEVVVVEDAHSSWESFTAWRMNRMWQYLGFPLVSSTLLDFDALCQSSVVSGSSP
jgi:nicotinamidase-related amidase